LGRGTFCGEVARAFLRGGGIGVGAAADVVVVAPALAGGFCCTRAQMPPSAVRLANRAAIFAPAFFLNFTGRCLHGDHRTTSRQNLFRKQ
jgi:hypothetical protein